MIHLKDIQGVFTNADQSDIPDNFATTLQNFKPLNGKLVKTFGIGDIFGLDVLDIIESGNWVDTGHVWDDGQYWLDSGGASMTKSIGMSIVNLTTYFNDNVYVGYYGSGEGYIIIAVIIASTSRLTALYYWTGINWIGVTTFLANSADSFYHNYGKNPIIQENEIIRFLPGGVGLTGSPSHEAIGMWLSFINRYYFDKLTSASAFYLYPVTPTAPDISTSGLNAVATVTAGGTWMAADGSRYYKLSYLYDGIVESLLSGEIKVTYTDSTYLQLLLTIDTTTFNWRRTAIKVYRSETGNIGDAAGSIDGSYELIHTIDLTRDPDNLSDYSGDADVYSGCLTGRYYIYIPEITTISLSYNYYYCNLGATYYRVYKPASTTQKLFQIMYNCNASGYTTGTTEAVGQADDSSWGFSGSITQYSGWVSIDSDSSGGFAGTQYIYLSSGTEFSEGILAGSMFTIMVSGSKTFRVIEGNKKRYLHFSTAITGLASTHYAWEILAINNGLYYFVESGTDINVYFFDTELTEGATYPLLNEPSIKVNGEFAINHLGRLWQLSIVLDPGGKNETHPDWLSYSEEDQYDINPVSNIIKIGNLSGGVGTGLVTSFNSILPLKKNSIHKLILTDISDPTSWILKTLYDKKGNIAKKGYIQIDSNVYFCATDGIYELDVNINAAIDDTLFIKSRISEPINDIYLALNDIDEKPYITCGYDRINTEIIWRLTSTSIWAFNILKKTWREIDTDITCDVWAYDQNDNLMCFNESDDQVYSIDEDESVGCRVATKYFDISGGEGQRKGTVRSVTIRYKSAVALLVRFYVDDSTDFQTGDEMAPALTQANWDTVAGWDLSASSLNHSSNGTGTISPLTSLAPIVSDIYKCAITLSACTVGNCTYTLGGTAGTTLSSATTYTDYIIASTTGDLIFTPSAASARFTISAVSVKKLTGRSLAIASDITTTKLAVRARCNRFKVEILDLTESTSNTEIHDIKIEVE